MRSMPALWNHVLNVVVSGTTEFSRLQIRRSGEPERPLRDSRLVEKPVIVTSKPVAVRCTRSAVITGAERAITIVVFNAQLQLTVPPAAVSVFVKVMVPAVVPV